MQIARRRERGSRRVVHGAGRPEDRQRRITLELVDEAAVPIDDIGDDREEAVQDGRHGVRGFAFGESGGSLDVDEKDSDKGVLAVEAVAAFHGELGDTVAHMSLEEFADLFALGESADHVVESLLQDAEFGGVVDVEHGIRVRHLYLLHTHADLTQRVGDGPRHQEGGADSAEEAERRQHDGGGVQHIAILGQPTCRAAHVDGDDAQQRHRGEHDPHGEKPFTDAEQRPSENPITHRDGDDRPRNTFDEKVRETTGRCSRHQERRAEHHELDCGTAQPEGYVDRGPGCPGDHCRTCLLQRHHLDRSSPGG